MEHADCTDHACQVLACKLRYWRTTRTPALRYGTGGHGAAAKEQWRGPSVAAREAAIVARAKELGQDIGRPS